MLDRSNSFGACEGCGEETVLIPLHGGKGGPVRCPLCVGKWNAEHGRRRRAGRVVIRAIKAFLDAGGQYNDIDKLKLSAGLDDYDGRFGLIDPLGYMTDIAKLDGADIDLTPELLADALRLTHPGAQYQALSLAAGRLQAAGEIETWSYWCRWDRPGHKVLVKPGYEIKDRKVHLLKGDERVVPVRN